MDKVPPSAKDLTKFPGEMLSWWKTVQPGWRILTGPDAPLSRTIPPGEDWSPLRRAGKDGLIVFVVALYWWRKVVEDQGDATSRAEFLFVAEDVVFVLDTMLGRDHRHEAPVDAKDNCTTISAPPSAPLIPVSTDMVATGSSRKRTVDSSSSGKNKKMKVGDGNARITRSRAAQK